MHSTAITTTGTTMIKLLLFSLVPFPDAVFMLDGVGVSVGNTVSIGEAANEVDKVSFL